MAIYENYINVKGFIDKQAQIRRDSHGKEFVILSLSTKASFRNRQTDQLVTSTDWHRLVVFGPLTETAKKLAKGAYGQSFSSLLGSSSRPSEHAHRKSILVPLTRFLNPDTGSVPYRTRICTDMCASSEGWHDQWA
jgi:hypothetical protein